METSVSRRSYLFWTMMLFAIYHLGRQLLSFLIIDEFMTPFYNILYPMQAVRNNTLYLSIILWSLPFLWIGLSMTFRRAADAGISPWFGILFFIPFVNFIFMAILFLLPTSQRNLWQSQRSKGKKPTLSIFSSILFVFPFSAVIVILIWPILALVSPGYNLTLFLATPFLMGMLQGYLLNYRNFQGLARTIGISSLTTIMVGLTLVLTALDGVICVLMALPLTLPLSLLGTFFGVAIARYTHSQSLTPMLLLLALPPVSWLESKAIDYPYQNSVVSRTEINAPPQEVWPHVIHFPDLPPPKEFLFRLGIAYPLRAQIDGQGVGAIRQCEFSTGTFVEPITHWEAPRRLAFSVKFNPQPMKEITPYDHLDAPHLDGYFRSTRGEFRLIPKGNKTVLEGQTWYEMTIFPSWYWQLYVQWFIGTIHSRVLQHIKNLAEST